MEVAELFVRLGVRGADKAKKDIGGVKEGMKGVVDNSLLAKAAIIGVVYALERMTMAAGQRGQDLQNFAYLTGQSAEELQKWQLAMRLAGGTADDALGTMKGVQSAIANIRATNSYPMGWEFFIRSVKDFDYNKLDDVAYVTGKIAEFSKMTASQSGLGNKLLGSLGATEGFIAATRNPKFDINKTPLGMILNPRTQQALSNVRTQWETFWISLENVRDQNVAAFGPGMINELSKAMKLFRSIELSIVNLIKQFPQLGTLAKAAFIPLLGLLVWAGGPITALSAAVTGLIFLMGEWQKHKDNDPNSMFGDSKSTMWEKFQKNVNEPNPNLGGKSIGDEMYSGKVEQALFRWLEKPNMSNIEMARPRQPKVVDNSKQTTIHAYGVDSAQELKKVFDVGITGQNNETYYQGPLAITK